MRYYSYKILIGYENILKYMDNKEIVRPVENNESTEI